MPSLSKNFSKKLFFLVNLAPESELTEVFRQLNLQERALLWLAYVEGHQHKEIAEMLGLKSLSVRVLLFRARRKLVNLLETV